MKCTCCQQREGADRGPNYGSYGYGSFCEECLLFKGGECCVEWANDYIAWCKRVNAIPVHYELRHQLIKSRIKDEPDIPKITDHVNAYLDTQDAISAIESVNVAEIINPKEVSKPSRKRHTCALGDFTTSYVACAKCFRNSYLSGVLAGAVFIIIVVIIVLMYN